MRRWVKRGALALLAIATVGLIVVASGLVPITASSEHWPVTSWLLHFAMRRSVSTHSLAVPAPPDLDDPALVVRGAGHYEGFCRPCHGAPGARMPPVPHAMTPHPPPLPPVVPELDDEELFYVVKHGVKFTAMPEWPARHRDDEVWSVVAFVRELPALDARSYRRLVFGEAPPEPDAPPVVNRVCARCHGADGMGRAEAFPRLSGQREAYLLASLEAYADGDRESGIMRPIAAALDREEMREAAAWYAGRPPMYERPLDAAASGRGARIAREGIADQRVPSCAACHGPSARPRHRVYPLLAGQLPRYLTEQLGLFRAGHRGGTAYSPIMRTASHELEDADAEAVARYYATLGAP